MKERYKNNNNTFNLLKHQIMQDGNGQTLQLARSLN